MKFAMNLAAFSVVFVAALAYFSLQSDGSSSQEIASTGGSDSKSVARKITNEGTQLTSQTVESEPKREQPVTQLQDNEDVEKTAGSKVKRHLGERLNPETHVPGGAPELRVVGEPMDPEKVYPNSGAKEFKLVGKRITDIENYLGEGAETPQYIGERIASKDIQ
ncbi:hypothetical protein [Idiomarina ramblicola]|uniref:Uncharacterized protein n=1 Tax=Idiomarina ramblicola TaxID=263724 RepID=A0A432Z1H8_9GAMM|nr:hypothetical protein [Idiomarina ramblicola]RUO71746.1 hypothetical protein CWI78_04315 [Idiomarina ramblicola]